MYNNFSYSLKAFSCLFTSANVKKGNSKDFWRFALQHEGGFTLIEDDTLKFSSTQKHCFLKQEFLRNWRCCYIANIIAKIWEYNKKSSKKSVISLLLFSFFFFFGSKVLSEIKTSDTDFDQ